jgi:hypothetical protein
MRDKLVIEHDGRMYAIAIDELVAFEVVDDATKAEFRAERDSGAEAEGFGFGDAPIPGGLPTPGDLPMPAEPQIGELRGIGDLNLRPTVFHLRR